MHSYLGQLRPDNGHNAPSSTENHPARVFDQCQQYNQHDRWEK